jgi:branched-subunit amino acid ABC-type transport system permease component
MKDIADQSKDIASESGRDSYAIRIISVLTIFFLPGAYVAALFTTNMFTFKDGEEVWIFWAVVGPLTMVVVIIIWIIWQRGKAKANRRRKAREDSITEP